MKLKVSIPEAECPIGKWGEAESLRTTGRFRIAALFDSQSKSDERTDGDQRD